MDDRVRNVNAEINRIDKFREMIHDLTVSEYGTTSDTADVIIKSGVLKDISSRLFDLKSFYEASIVDVPFPIRDK